MAGELEDKAQCASCGTKNQVMKRCTRCKAVVYCSRECQAKHWQQHKFLCGPNPQEIIQESHQLDESPQPTNSRVDAVPLRSGSRVLPDGRYESYVDGMRCDDRGFPMPKREEQTDGKKEKTVRPCISCGGQGRTSTTCEGIVRTEYCSNCDGEGVLLQ